MYKKFFSLFLILFLAFNCNVYASDNSSYYYEIVNEEPSFSKSEYSTKSYEKYSELDDLGRCGVAIACIGKDLMPTEKRGAIGMIKPSGWQTIKFDFIDGKYLYNRCHLIGYQLSGENVNEQNLITGTRSLNVKGMLPFENKVADYVKETNNHVLYKVTPVFKNDELVARYVKIEAYSVEDLGKGINFVVNCFNKEKGIKIDYLTGKATLADDNKSNNYTQPEAQAYYVINTNTKKFHRENCHYVDLSSLNQKKVHKSKKQLVNQGYDACKVCNP